MRVIVAGAGQVGSAITRYLVRAGADVTVVDRDPAVAQRLGDALDVQAVVGHAALPSVLEQAGAADADLLVAVTHVDEVNMVACQVAHSLFNVPTRIARVREQDYLRGRFRDLFRREHIPIDVVISPELEVAHAIALRLSVPGALTLVPFAEDRVRLVGLRMGEHAAVLDTPLRQLTHLFPDLHIVCVGILRGERFFLPSGDDTIRRDDEVYFVVETAHLSRALPVFGREERIGERIVIVGGGNIGFALAQELEKRASEFAVTVVEASRARAEFVAERLARAVVLNGDARALDLLREAGAEKAAAVVAVTDSDETNILSALLAKQLGTRWAITLVNKRDYEQLTASIGIDVTVNPRDTTVSSILAHIRRGRIRAVHTIRDGAAEVFEAEALDTSPVVGTPLRELRAQGLVVGAVVRQGTVVAPRGDTVLRAGDRVILAARGEAVKRVEQLFAVRLDYF
ncbi:MAG: Trk system potassium transporter TrkA [Geminicoccaceae bacterium]|nr:Trk system potassium transporter TrkA [Geminicoccaceae bacterium]MCS7268209.1 Trk system potassium transporter TrkA [Geminicoccaceae bacterium]MCX7631180.1 Trk system potassium transporter TrkA [Geminicoccaceae bacterium]MDW8125021.1 Trk system potassium transporter TrkA [Geminicoccaceae bacterium]MDW8341232.1 Trk system potassium transporter TrkA [Geminicoccaceae bacterium]